MKLKKFHAVVLLALLPLFAQSSYAADIYDSEPSFSPYYSGSVKSSVLYDALEELNYIRWLIGVPNNVTLDSEMTRKAQHGAVLLDAIDTLTHTPSKPSDMSTSFYELGYDATSHGNLAVSQIYYGSDVSGHISLSFSTKGYMYDSDQSNISRVGHRRWLMNPRMTRTGFGISTRRGYAVTYVIEEFGSSSETLTQEEYERYLEWLKWPISDEYITWPTAKHLHPLTYFEAGTAWSVTLDRNVFAEVTAADVTVRLTRQSDGRSWTFSGSGSDGYFSVADDTVAYDQCIIFRPDGVSEYRDGEIWRVYVSGLKRLDGTTDSISYSVEFSDEQTGYEESGYSLTPDYGYSESSKGSSSGGCNSGFGGITAILVLGILRRKVRAGR
ncbi:MAG: CAP domain-containing protein [Synergistaceae bacterium]|nr:CAP domain-containing protein [Synergistaceae bacterium]